MSDSAPSSRCSGETITGSHGGMTAGTDSVTCPFPYRSPTTEEQALKAHQLRLWQQAIRDWLIEQPFTARLVMRLQLIMVVDSRVTTACTDGEHIFVNAHFAARCDASLRRFVLGHELYHVLLGHFRRRLGRDTQRWNLAVDAEVNYRLLQDGLSPPDEAVFYPAQAGQSAEVIYQWLLDHPCPGIDTPFDRHGDLAGWAMHSGDQPRVVDSAYAPLSTDTVATRQRYQQWQETLREAMQHVTAGELPQGIAQCVETGDTARVDWVMALREFITRQRGGTVAWHRPNRRFWSQGLYLPDRQHTTLSVLVAMDTSGSTRRHLPRFLAELERLLASVGNLTVHLIECDAAIQRERVLTSPHALQESTSSSERPRQQLRGGGGTDFRPVFARAAALQPDCLVYFTDGCGRAPHQPPDFPVLWIMTEDRHPPVSWGHSLTLEDA